MDNFQHHISEALDFIKDWNFTRKKKMVGQYFIPINEFIFMYVTLCRGFFELSSRCNRVAPFY